MPIVTAANAEKELDATRLLRVLGQLDLLAEVVPSELQMELYYLDGFRGDTLREALSSVTTFTPYTKVQGAPLWRLQAGHMLKTLQRDGVLGNIRWSPELDLLYLRVTNLNKEVTPEEAWNGLRCYLTPEGTMTRKQQESDEAKASGERGSRIRISDDAVNEWIEEQTDEVLSKPKTAILKLFRQDHSCEQGRFQLLLATIREQRFPGGLPKAQRGRPKKERPRSTKKAKAAAKSAARSEAAKPKKGRALAMMDKLKQGADKKKAAEAAQDKAIKAAKRAKLPPDEVQQAGKLAYDAALAQTE